MLEAERLLERGTARPLLLRGEEVGRGNGVAGGAGPRRVRPPELAAPLAPPYRPVRPVSRVWSTADNTERLYRYTHMQGCIYPPGYLP